MTFEEKFDRVEPILIGLWRFRTPSKKIEWAATWAYRAVFYDTYPQKTKDEALDIVWREWQKIKGKKRKPIKAKVRG